MDRADWRDDSRLTLSPPQIRGVVPRLGQRIRAASLAARIDKGAAEGMVISFELAGPGRTGLPGRVRQLRQAVSPPSISCQQPGVHVCNLGAAFPHSMRLHLCRLLPSH